MPDDDSFTGRVRRYAQVSTSIGIAPFNGAEELSADEVVVEADIAMYDAKEAGKDRFAVYERAHGRRERMSVDQNWNQRLRRALDEDRFVLHAHNRDQSFVFSSEPKQVDDFVFD